MDPAASRSDRRPEVAAELGSTNGCDPGASDMGSEDLRPVLAPQGVVSRGAGVLREHDNHQEKPVERVEGAWLDEAVGIGEGGPASIR